MSGTNLNIKFTPDELQVMQNKEFFITKRIITQKLYKLLNEVKENLEKTPVFSQYDYPEGTDSTTGKITKGENYLHLPYIILDFPRLFGKDEVFAFRSMYWWGHYFIFTLHISGRKFEDYYKNFEENIHFSDIADLYFYINENEWEHAISDQNYKKVDLLTLEEIKNFIRKHGFLKIAKTLPAAQWQKAPAAGASIFEEFSQLILPKNK